MSEKTPMVQAMLIFHEHERQLRSPVSAASTNYYDLDGNCHDKPGEGRIALSARTSYRLSDIEQLVTSLLGSTAEKNDAAPVRT